ncbi:MAG: bifunctional DNA-formamidopyrimidine glycosylase/DNA-(apurinic or apyrimidinic site) lyase [Legionellales bacterium]
MPELPEVETVLQGLKPHIEGAFIQEVVVRHQQLRWPIPADLKNHLVQTQIAAISRRAKYLLVSVTTGTMIIHLGMSGSLRIVTRNTSPGRHDHVDVVFSDTHLIRYTDPRRFGAILWTEDDPYQHPLLKTLGPEPLEANFTATYLYQSVKNRRKTIKEFIMDSHVVVGIGNIYAAEALFSSQIHPCTPAGLLTETDCVHLVESIQAILQSAIKQGGTTVKDFINSDGKPGYFAQELQAYARGGLPCRRCQAPLTSIKLGQRSTVFCANCQKVPV